MFKLAWVMYDGSFDEIQKTFKTEKELHDWVKSIKSKNEYVWRKDGSNTN